MEKEKKTAKPERKPEEDRGDVLIRILGQDISANKGVYVGLTYIKGISWAISNALCIRLGLNKATKISELDKDTIKRIEKELTNLNVPAFLKNRRSDLDSGQDMHLLTTNLDVRKEFDIKRLKKIKSYRGIRHSLGQPVRGQRTRSHFRKKGGSTGVKKKKDDKKA